MPVFDRSASRPGRAEADLLRSVLGPAKPRATSLQQVSHEYCWQPRRAICTRALIVLALIGSLCGSAVMMSENRPPPSGAARVSPPAAVSFLAQLSEPTGQQVSEPTG